MSDPMQLLLIALCMAIAAFFSGIETGIISIHRVRLRHFVKQKSFHLLHIQMISMPTDLRLGLSISTMALLSINVLVPTLCSIMTEPSKNIRNRLGSGRIHP